MVALILIRHKRENREVLRGNNISTYTYDIGQIFDIWNNKIIRDENVLDIIPRTD